MLVSVAKRRQGVKTQAVVMQKAIPEGYQRKPVSTMPAWNEFFVEESQHFRDKRQECQ